MDPVQSSIRGIGPGVTLRTVQMLIVDDDGVALLTYNFSGLKTRCDAALTIAVHGGPTERWVWTTTMTTKLLSIPPPPPTTTPSTDPHPDTTAFKALPVPEQVRITDARAAARQQARRDASSARLRGPSRVYGN